MSECVADRTPFGEMLVAPFGMTSGTTFPRHVHEQHQLIWASAGVLGVDAAGEQWMLPSNLALWMPAGVPHEVTATRPADMLGVYLLPRLVDGWAEPTLCAVTPLLRELLLHLADPCLDQVGRRRAEKMVVDQLRPVATTRLHLPMPADPRALAIAEALVARPADDRSLDRWAADVNASVRTLSRIWQAETGMGFAQWRTQVRLRAALPALAAGTPIRSAARAVGYDTTSGFVSAFRRATGRTPAAYFALTAD